MSDNIADLLKTYFGGTENVWTQLNAWYVSQGLLTWEDITAYYESSENLHNFADNMYSFWTHGPVGGATFRILMETGDVLLAETGDALRKE